MLYIDDQFSYFFCLFLFPLLNLFFLDQCSYYSKHALLGITYVILEMLTDQIPRLRLQLKLQQWHLTPSDG